jgi:hypothetical protein
VRAAPGATQTGSEAGTGWLSHPPGNWLPGYASASLHVLDRQPRTQEIFMTTELQFTPDELAHLHLLLSQDTESSRVELHHTSGAPYRDFIKRRVERGEALLMKMNGARPELAMNVTNSQAF